MMYKLINFYKIPRISLKDYEDVTASFDDVFTSVRGNILELNEDIEKKDTNNIIISKGIDFNQLISSIPEASISDK